MRLKYAPDSFSLIDVPSTYRPEFTQNAHWLKFSFHARYNQPEFPYESNDDLLQRDYFDVMRELVRIVGIDALATTTTLHYVAATEAGCSFLHRFGVHGLIGMFYNCNGREALHYYLPSKHWNDLQCGFLYRDPHTNICFAHNDIILNQYSIHSAEEKVRQIDAQIIKKQHSAFFQLMTHEQYFYSDYIDFQPDFEEKMLLVVKYLHDHGYLSCFFEELIMN